MKAKEIKPTAQLELKDWSTMERDISLAHDILARYHDLDEGQSSIYLQEATIFLEGSIQIKQADWVVDLQEKYETLYGEEKGDEVLRRVLSAFLTFGNTIH
jgi:hypothetical protein